MTEDLEQLLKNLKLSRMLEIYDEQLRGADKDDISYTDFITRLLRRESQTDSRVCGVGLYRQGRKHRVGRRDRAGKNRIGVRSSIKGPGERLSLSVRPRTRFIR